MPDGRSPGDAPRLRILFFLGAINYDRVFEGFLRELLRRGHEVTILLGPRAKGLPVGAGEVLPALAAEFDGRLRWEVPGPGPAPNRQEGVARRLRQLLDYLRYLEPEYAAASVLRARSRGRLGRPLARVVDRVAGGPRGRSLLGGVLRALEQALPVSPELVDRISGEGPDVVMVAPLIALGSHQAEVLRAADRLGVPTVFPVASWDNLTNKGLVRDVPTRTIVWNDDQVDEAVRLQGLPRERVHAVGAHAYDHWFAWSTRTSAEEFCERAGLDPTRPFFLYACSSAFIAGDETIFVREWLERLRGTGGELATVGVLVRPHPQHVHIWRQASLEDERAVVWPIGGEVPTGVQRKADYFDSLRHSSGVIGINTSALIEAAIARRPVFTVVTERYRETQSGTLHFGYLAGAEGGVLNVATTWDEHLGQLAEALADPDRYAGRAERFLGRFVRPYGLEQAAAPLAADVVERAAGERAELRPRRRAPAWARVTIGLVLAAARLR